MGRRRDRRRRLVFLAASLAGGEHHARHGSWLAVLGWFAAEQALLAVAGWLRPGRSAAGPGRDEALATGAVLVLGVFVARAGYAGALALVPLYVVSRMALLSAQRYRYLRLDPLTGLLGRPALAAEVAARARAGERFALFLLDLDRFRRVEQPDRAGWPYSVIPAQAGIQRPGSWCQLPLGLRFRGGDG